MNYIKPICAMLLIAAASSAPMVTKQIMPSVQSSQKEVVDKVSVLALKVTFAKYDQDKSGKLERKEVDQLLADADVGNWFTRNSWVDGVLGALDIDKDGALSFPELLKAIN